MISAPGISSGRLKETALASMRKLGESGLRWHIERRGGSHEDCHTDEELAIRLHRLSTIASTRAPAAAAPAPVKRPLSALQAEAASPQRQA